MGISKNDFKRKFFKGKIFLNKNKFVKLWSDFFLEVYK